MSIGNLKDYGNKGNNFPWQLKMLQGLQAIATATSAPLTCVDDSVTICNANIDAFTFTNIGGDDALNVNIAGGVTLEVNLDAANDQVGIYGYVNGVSGSPVPLNVNATGQVAIQDGGNSITVDGTVDLGATTLTALENITVQNGAGAAAVNIQDGGNSITVDATALPLPTGAATEVTLAAVDTKLTAAARTPNILTDIGVGSTPTGVYSFSIANVGTAAGLVNGQSVPAGVTINFDGGALNNTLNSLPYDASGTTFIITWIS